MSSTINTCFIHSPFILIPSSTRIPDTYRLKLTLSTACWTSRGQKWGVVHPPPPPFVVSSRAFSIPVAARCVSIFAVSRSGTFRYARHQPGIQSTLDPLSGENAVDCFVSIHTHCIIYTTTASHIYYAGCFQNAGPLPTCDVVPQLTSDVMNPDQGEQTQLQHGLQHCMCNTHEILCSEQFNPVVAEQVTQEDDPSAPATLSRDLRAALVILT